MRLEAVLVTFFVVGGGLWLLRPLVQAFADRVRHRGEPSVPAVSEDVLDELHAMRREMAELAERVEFAERLLARQREGARLVPPT